MNNSGAPILVTGAHRSGTTWVGRMLSANNQTFYIHEPFNNVRAHGPVWVPTAFPNWFFYLSPTDTRYDKQLDAVVAMRYPVRAAITQIRTPRHAVRAARDWALSLDARARHKRPLIKDPIALFSAERLAERFDMLVVVLLRHPAAFAASLKRLNWRFKFSNWVQQEALLRDLLPELRTEIEDAARHKPDLLDQSILMWNAFYSVVHKYQLAHPDWSFIRQEDLAAAPLEGFRTLYQHCGLAWTSATERKIREHSFPEEGQERSQARPHAIRRESQATIGAWKQELSDIEIERVRTGTARYAGHFYGPRDW